MSHDLARNLADIRVKIQAAAERSGRSPKAVQLLAVTKRSDPVEISALYQLGIRKMGENRVQDLLKKKNLLPPDIEWHFIGSLQTNKVRSLLGQTSLIHSLDRWHLASEIQKQAEEQGR
ncbi:MAG: YggS family pyridoxal phosphate-dependent enzyme, partial [Clostridia bacterium]|nr:YggS family pyridoxal phosphate-dependent enzyme [Clostridia bacterium]